MNTLHRSLPDSPRRRRVPIAAVCVLGILASAAQAQHVPRTGVAVVDSAAVARAAYRDAGAALQRGDLDAARRAVTHAARAWPTQEAYVWSRASLSARAHDTADVRAALRDYLDLGLGRDVRQNPNLKSLADVPAFATLVRQLDENRSPRVRSVVRGQIDDSTFYPEGMDVDPSNGHVFVASIRHGTIAELDAQGRLLRELLPWAQPGIGAIMGVRVDTARHVLWATAVGLPQSLGYQRGDSTVAALIQVRMSDGVLEKRWDLTPASAGHVLGDLAVGPDGTVAMTDSNEPVLYVLRPAADSLTRIENPYFHSLQGVAFAPGGHTLYVADYSHGLLHLDLDSRRVTRLVDAPHSTSLGCDGIVWFNGSIIAVQNGVDPARVVRFFLDRSGGRITRVEVLDQNSDVADEPTIGAMRGGEFLYVATSQWNKFTDAGVRRPEVPLTMPRILGVPVH
ncbi:MAG: hypothetical protein U0163_03355 [Gemmatimonadaceae bacterium]